MEQSEQMVQLVEQLRSAPGLSERISGTEGAMIRAAVEGQSVYEIASEHEVSEGAVWQVLASAARAATGAKVEPVETGGLRSDTDPGISGGYGDTGFGSLGNEPPMAVPGEPELNSKANDAQEDDTPRPSQAEGEDEGEQAGGGADSAPRPSQAEGEDSDQNGAGVQEGKVDTGRRPRRADDKFDSPASGQERSGGADDAPRPSQAEGEDDAASGHAGAAEDAPRPSQAEGENESSVATSS